MIGRRQTLALLAALGMGRLHAQSPSQIPALSTAPLGEGPAPGWIHERLPKVKQANRFAVMAEDGRRVLRVRSEASASSWVARSRIDAARRPWLHWQWKVSRSLPGSDVRIKGGDDYAARLYVFFDLPLDRLPLLDRVKVQAARALSSQEIPTASLCYVWGRAQPVGHSAWNPYTDRVRMLVVDSGDEHAGQWRSHARDIRDDWAQSFGGPMPPVTGVAVGADTDNTISEVEAWFGDLRFEGHP